MANPLVLLPNAVSQGQPQIVFGVVSPHQAAPAAFGDPLYVTIPSWNPDHFWVVNSWPACNGNTLPSQGAQCILIFDDQRPPQLWCIYWVGAYSVPPDPGG